MKAAFVIDADRRILSRHRKATAVAECAESLEYYAKNATGFAMFRPPFTSVIAEDPFGNDVAPGQILP